MSDRRPTSPVLPIAVTLAVLLGLYVGAYYYWIYGDVPKNRVMFDIQAKFFAPVIWVDQRLRPEFWGMD